MTVIKLALLECDQVLSSVEIAHGDYGRIFKSWLASALARIAPDDVFEFDSYRVFRDMAYPPDDVEYDGLLISGSRASAYEDVEWINKLVAYVKRIVAEKPALKIFGICFGHQIIARALGGSCVKNDDIWEVSVTTVPLTPLGRAVFGTDRLDLQQMHRDHVPTWPSNAHVLGYTDVTPNHGMVMFDSEPDPDAPIDLTSIRILTIQGHPEFTRSIMSMLLDARVGILGEQLVADGHLREGGIPGRHHPDGLACDGVGVFGKVVWGVLGVSENT